jgi:uncharacterized coiled-coil protein SlyX
MSDGRWNDEEIEAEVQRRMAIAKEEEEKAAFVGLVYELRDRVDELEREKAEQSRVNAEQARVNAEQQIVIDALGKGFDLVAGGMQKVEDGQLLAPAKRKLIGYTSGAAVGGGGVVWGLIEIIKAIAGG